MAATATLELKMSHTGRDGGLHYWLLLEGTAVSYAKIYELTDSDGTLLELCDIETREGFRNRGYATALLNALAEGYSVEAVSHSGSYTPNGFHYIASKLQRKGEPASAPSVSAMSFVHDWDEMIPNYG